MDADERTHSARGPRSDLPPLGAQQPPGQLGNDHQLDLVLPHISRLFPLVEPSASPDVVELLVAPLTRRVVLFDEALHVRAKEEELVDA